MKTECENPDRILHIVHLTNLLMEDIRVRKLVPGDSYYTTIEASRFLNVSGGVANSALQLLEKRRIIKRSQRVGAIIQNRPQHVAKERSHVMFVVYEHYFRKEGAGSGEILAGLQSELPGTIVEVSLISRDREIEQMSRIIDNTLKNNETDAFILLSTSFDVQQMIARTSLPAVIFGTPYPSIKELPYMDQDREDTHHQIIRHLRSRHRHNLVYLFRDMIHPGEKLSLKTIRRYPEFTHETPVLFTTSNEDEIAAEIADVFESGYMPDAFICNSIIQAEVVEEVLLQRGLEPYRDVDIVVTSYFLQRGSYAKYTHIEKGITTDVIGKMLGKLLKDKLHNESVNVHITPVRLVVCQRDVKYQPTPS